MLVAAAVATAVVTAATPANAAPREVSPAATGFVYRAPAECPARSEIEPRIAPDVLRERVSVSLSVTPSARGFRGRVEVGSGEGRVARGVEGRTCAAVVEALLLVVALDAAPVETDPGDDAASPRATADVASPVASGDPARDEAPAAAGARSTERLTGPIFGLGMGVFTLTLADDATVTGGAVAADVALDAPLFGLPFLEPSTRLALGRTLTATPMVYPRVASEPAGEAASMLLTAATLDLCPLGFGHGQRLAAALCARGEVGSLEVGVHGDDLSRQGHLWATLGAAARIRYVAGDPTSHVRPIIELVGGLVAPMRLDRFHFDAGGVTMARTEVWTGGLTAGVVLR